jgi:hypothetical protein
MDQTFSEIKKVLAKDAESAKEERQKISGLKFSAALQSLRSLRETQPLISENVYCLRMSACVCGLLYTNQETE